MSMQHSIHRVKIAALHRGSAPVQPTYLGGAMWGQELSSGQPATRSWTTPANTDLLICIAPYEYVATRGTPSWNGAAMTLIQDYYRNPDGVAAWALAAPDIGTYNLTFSGFTIGGSGRVFCPALIALQNASAVGIGVATNGAASGASPASVSITPGAATDYLVGAVLRNDPHAVTPDGGQTVVGNVAEPPVNEVAAAGVKPATGTGSHSFSWSWTGGSNENYAAMALKISGV